MTLAHTEWNRALCAPQAARTLSALYGKQPESAVAARIDRLLDGFSACFPGGAQALFSAPGRAEICGNHTDHQHGRVFAGSVQLDILAAVRRNEEGCIRVRSEGFAPVCVRLDALAPVASERGGSAAIVRGVAARFAQLGCRVGGFDAYLSSAVPSGGGLSSSAAFGILAGTILNELFNGGGIPPLRLAQIGQYAENVYFGKRCGLMDQTACAVGGAVYMDFESPGEPAVEPLPFDPAAHGYAMCVVDSGADHADLSDEYSAMPAEMGAVAARFGKEVLRELPEQAFLARLAALRAECGDRAVLRAYHYFEEDKRVAALREALLRDDFDAFLSLVHASGRSSSAYLQNVIPCGAAARQPLAFALMLCDSLLGGRGAFRVHGGGLAGTVLAFVPLDLLSRFCAGVEAALGARRCTALHIRPAGGVKIAALP